MRGRKIFLCVVMIFFAAVMSGCGGSPKAENKEPEKVVEEAPKVPPVENKNLLEVVDVNDVASDPSANRHWIKDLNNGAYVWNPEPQDGESVRWSGSFVEEGGNRYAQGRGTLTWYKNGEVIQTDEGSFERGRHHGQFRHTFRSGRVDYSNWDHGQEIP